MIALSDGAARAALAEEVQRLAAVNAEFLPGDVEHLRNALGSRTGGLLLLDLSLVPAVLPVLTPGRFQVIGLTSLRQDPRSEKLAQWGAPTLHLAQAAAFLARSAAMDPATAQETMANVTPSQSAMAQSAMAQAAWTPSGWTQAAPPPQVPPGSPGQHRVTAVHSPKGGAGTSTVAAHLASQWARQGLRVLLADLSAYGAASILCKSRQQGAGLEALSAALEISPDLLTEDFDPSPYLVPLFTASGRLDLLPGARPRLMDRLPPAQLSLLIGRLAQLPYDRIVLDTAAEPTPRTLSALESAHQLLLVATQEYTACWNLIHLQELLGTLRPRAERLLILNRHSGAGISPGELQERLGLPMAAILPTDPLLPEAGNQGKPWDLGAGSSFADAIGQLAAALHPAAAVGAYG